MRLLREQIAVIGKRTCESRPKRRLEQFLRFRVTTLPSQKDPQIVESLYIASLDRNAKQFLGFCVPSGMIHEQERQIVVCLDGPFLDRYAQQAFGFVESLALPQQQQAQVVL